MSEVVLCSMLPKNRTDILMKVNYMLVIYWLCLLKIDKRAVMMKAELNLEPAFCVSCDKTK